MLQLCKHRGNCSLHEASLCPGSVSPRRLTERRARPFPSKTVWLCGSARLKKLDIPIMQDELTAAVSRNTAGTMLKRMATRGLIELGYRAKIVCFPAALRAFVESG